MPIEIILSVFDPFQGCLELIRWERTHIAAYSEACTALQKAYEVDQKKLPKAVYKKANGPEWDAMAKPFRDAAKVLGALREKQAEAHRKELRELATVATIPPGFEDTEQCTRVEWVYAGAYSNQTASKKYALASARGYLDQAELYGLEGHVEVTDSGGIDVFVNCDADTWEVVKAKPGVSLKEWVRLCWKRGVNPRVFNPYLPHGFEEKNGLDFFGGSK